MLGGSAWNFFAEEAKGSVAAPLDPYTFMRAAKRCSACAVTSWGFIVVGGHRRAQQRARPVGILRRVVRGGDARRAAATQQQGAATSTGIVTQEDSSEGGLDVNVKTTPLRQLSRWELGRECTRVAKEGSPR